MNKVFIYPLSRRKFLFRTETTVHQDTRRRQIFPLLVLSILEIKKKMSFNNNNGNYIDNRFCITRKIIGSSRWGWRELKLIKEELKTVLDPSLSIIRFQQTFGIILRRGRRKKEEFLLLLWWRWWMSTCRELYTWSWKVDINLK